MSIENYDAQGRLKSPAAATTLQGLSDVNASSPTDNQSLTWDAATSKWVPETVSGSGTVIPGISQARLTVVSGTPVPTSDQASPGTIYLTPYRGDTIALYNGTAWSYYTLTEKSLALSGLTSGKNYDVFVYDNAGTLTLELSAAWTNDTTRADALTTVNGVRLKSGATTRRLVGTIRATGAATTADTERQRFVWNEQHRVQRPVSVVDGTDNWTYTTAAWRQANGSASNQIEVVTGIAQDMIDLTLVAFSQNGGNNARSVSFGEASNTPIADTIIGRYADAASGSAYMQQHWSKLTRQARLGFTDFRWLEYSAAAGTTTWYGDGSSPEVIRSGMTGTWWC